MYIIYKFTDKYILGSVLNTFFTNRAGYTLKSLETTFPKQECCWIFVKQSPNPCCPNLTLLWTQFLACNNKINN